ncbi:Potassium transporter [Arachis hypogaea]|nr:Potassium transporter [Arachis hypogaea]
MNERVVHTSTEHEGQVYILEINYMFMIASVIMCVAFKTTEKISQAYEIAVIGDMLITTWLVSLIMVVIWKKSIWQATIFLLVFGCIKGGHIPIVSSLFLTKIMGIKHYVHKDRYMFELRNKVHSEYIRELAMDRCGYKDKLEDSLVFESQLIQNLKAFIHLDKTEVNFIDMAMQRGVMYMLDEVEVVDQPNSSFLNKIVGNYAYIFLRKNFCQGNQLMAVPRKRLLMIGMTYEI